MSYSFQASGGSLTETGTSYSYDAIDELTQAVEQGATAETYSYDAVGNRLSSLGVPSYAYNSSTELTSAGSRTYAYDADGNTLSVTAPNGTTSYTWDFENRMTQVTLPGTGGAVTFEYDPFGRRIEKISPASGTTIYAYDGDNIAETLNSSGTATARYTQGLGIDEPLEVYEGSASYYYQADGLGSIVALTKRNGSVADSYTYGGFGQGTSSGTLASPFQFTGRELDPELSTFGVYYYRARYYDPLMGRFLSEDPIRFAGATNAYPYTDNDPLNLIDPSGMQHAPGGPEHPEPGVQFRCRWTDDCAALSAKIEIFKKVIADHIAWDAARGATTHTDNGDIPNLQRGLDRCILIHRLKCTEKGPPCEPVPAPVPSPKGFSLPSVPALPPPSPGTTLGVGSILLIITLIVLSPVGG